MVALLDGSFDCFYFEKKDGKIKPLVKNIQGLQAAKIFIEDKECRFILDKIEAWHQQRSYVTEHYGHYDYSNQVNKLKQIAAGIAKLRASPALNKERMAGYVTDYFLQWIEYCAPGKKSKFYAACQKLQQELTEWSTQVDKDVWQPIV